MGKHSFLPTRAPLPHFVLLRVLKGLKRSDPAGEEVLSRHGLSPHRGTDPDPQVCLPPSLPSILQIIPPLAHCKPQNFVPFTPDRVQTWQGRWSCWCHHTERWQSPLAPSCFNLWPYLGVWAKISWEHSQRLGFNRFDISQLLRPPR